MADSKIRAGQPKARCGVSLIEVLVVLVILVVGILVIIRLYPSGFFSVQSVGNAAVADSLGTAALQAAQENLGSLPEAIQPGGTNVAGMDAYGRPIANAADASYDPEFNLSVQPDYSQTLNKAQLIVNETFTVPTSSTIVKPSGNELESIYVTKFGPIMTEVPPSGSAQPYTPVPKLQNYLSINSANWQPVTADTASSPPTQNVLEEGQPQFSVDYVHQRIAVPYAAYDANGNSYSQEMIVSIIGSNYRVYTEYLIVPAGTPRDSINPNAPRDASNITYLPDPPSGANYNGGWFDPTVIYGDSGAGVQSTLPAGVTWLKVSLYRPYKGIASTDVFSKINPYEFKLTSPNLGSTPYNLGGLGFNPMAGGGVGRGAFSVRVSYQVANWQVIHEDRAVPALPSGNTSVLRLSLKNLKRAGDEGPDNSIDPGLLSSGHSLYIMDLDTGQQVAPGIAAPDPTNPDLPIVDEDVQGTSTDPAAINISFAIGRLTFASNSFGDNPNGTTPHAHRVRVFYTGDLNWTIAVQKAPAYYIVDAPITGSSADILPGHCAYSILSQNLLFPQMDSGKTVAIDGPANLPNQTGVASNIVDGNVVTDSNGNPIKYVGFSFSATQPASITAAQAAQITAVRGLSARAIVAWQERGQWKSHSVDTILNRTP